ncbi:MAG: hypothetical protein ACYSWO_30495 [Planctomycetota bacterium]|jgi:hypothetical protein
MDSNKSIRDLVGMEVSAVSFVRDYVEIHFDGPILRCLSNPILRSKDEEWVFPQAGSRDALCLLIGQSLEGMTLEDDTMLLAGFSGGQELFVPLDRKRRRGPEAMHFLPDIGEPLQVW